MADAGKVRILREGVFAVHKPVGPSSAQIIRDCQEAFGHSAFFRPLLDSELSRRASESNNQRKRRGQGKRDLRVKMGHGGTLDPLASGVLILGVGAGTKSLQDFLNCSKTYETVVLFGAGTDTYDRVGRVVTQEPYAHVTRAAVEDAIRDHFTGKIAQRPPVYSALKHQGKPLYEYAREGKEIPADVVKPREVTILDIELLEWLEPGTHAHRWPVEAEAEAPAEEDVEAVRAYENLKRKFEKAADNLVTDKPPHKRTRYDDAKPAMMSGALSQSSDDVGDVVSRKDDDSSKKDDDSSKKDDDSSKKDDDSNKKNNGGGGGGGSKKDRAPRAFVNNRKGANLIPELDANAPAPWSDIGPPAARVRMTVTSGFYVRSFCHDLGERVGSAAMMAELARSRQGDFSVGGPLCLEYGDIAKREDAWAPKVARALAWWDAKTYGEDQKPVIPDAAVRAEEYVRGGEGGGEVEERVEEKTEETTGKLSSLKEVMDQQKALKAQMADKEVLGEVLDDAPKTAEPTPATTTTTATATAANGEPSSGKQQDATTVSSDDVSGAVENGVVAGEDESEKVSGEDDKVSAAVQTQ